MLGGQIIAEVRHPWGANLAPRAAAGGTHLYGNGADAALLIAGKKTLYNVSWVVTISFVV